MFAEPFKTLMSSTAVVPANARRWNTSTSGDTLESIKRYRFGTGKATGGKKDFVHIDTTNGFTKCEFQGKDNAFNEDNFDLYVHLNHKFRCTHGNHSTTQWWFGAYI